MAEFWKKLGAIGIGLLTLEVVNQGFDYVLYPLVIYKLGPIDGGVVMIVLALVLNLSLVVLYNITKQDWLGFEWLALQEDRNVGSLVGKAISAGRWPAFVFLSWEDPFKAFVFVRGRKQVGWRFTLTDWQWFLGANLLGNLIWIVMVSGVIETLRYLF